MTSGENLDIKAFTSTESIGKKSAALISNLKLNGFLSLSGKNTFAMRSFRFMGQE